MAAAIKHVLIADDDHLVQRTFQLPLEEAGYIVGIANNGHEALVYIAAHLPDVVLLDVFMPERDGLETLIEIKRKFPATRIIVMSGGGMKGRYEYLSTASKFGADGVLRKPVLPSELLKMLQSVSFAFGAMAHPAETRLFGGLRGARLPGE